MKISYTDISKFLKSCIWNPRLPGPLKIISEINNPDYYETRAIEFIKEAQTLELRLDSNLPTYDDYIIKAIRLLALGRLTRYNRFKELDELIKQDKIKYGTEDNNQETRP